MPISRVDYEIAPADTVELPTVDFAGVSAAAQALADATVTAPPAVSAQPAKDTPGDAGQGEEAAKATVKPAAPPAKVVIAKQPPASQPPPEEPDENAVRPEWSGGGSDFANRLDSVRGRLNNQASGAGELPALLDQAVTLLETLAAHPAMADYAVLKQRLDNVEQILNSSGNVR
jgi:hypothetical protein